DVEAVIEPRNVSKAGEVDCHAGWEEVEVRPVAFEARVRVARGQLHLERVGYRPRHARHEAYKIEILPVGALAHPGVRVVQGAAGHDLVGIDRQVLRYPACIEVYEIPPAPVHRFHAIEVAFRLCVEDVHREIHVVVRPILERRQGAGRITVADGEHATAEIGDDAAIELLPAQAGGCDRIDQVAHGQTQLRVSGDVVGGGIGGVHEVVPAQPRST